MFTLSRAWRIRRLIAQLGDGGRRPKARDELVKLGSAAVRPLLLEFSECRDYTRRVHILHILRDIADPSAAQPLTEILRYGLRLELAQRTRPISCFEPADFRFPEALHAIVQIGPGAVESLVALLSDELHPMRWMAAEALGRIGDRRALEPLKAALLDNSDDANKTMKKALLTLAQRPESSTPSQRKTPHSLSAPPTGESQASDLLSKLEQTGQVTHVLIVSTNSLAQVHDAGAFLESIQPQLGIDVRCDLRESCDLAWIQIDRFKITEADVIKMAKKKWGGRILNGKNHTMSAVRFTSALVGSGYALLIRQRQK